MQRKQLRTQRQRSGFCENYPGAGIFCALGHGQLVDVDSIPIQVWNVSRDDDAPPFLGALNCTFPMPFSQSAEISLVNTSDGPRPFNLHYYVDWEQHGQLEEPALHFRATFNEEVTEPPEGRELAPHGKGDPQLQNLSDADNYRFLDVDGFQGHYIGTGLSIKCEPAAPGKWWEGDDMFVIDGEPWPPRLHGTGHEDYFNVAYGFHRVGCRPEYGVPYLEKTDRDTHMIDGRFSMYRFHVSDPIPFEKSIVASIEHGHANDCTAHYRSVAYWYAKSLV